MTSQNTLLQIVTDSPLSTTTKDFFKTKIQREGATQANIVALRELLRAVKHQGVANMGLEINPNDPTIKAAQTKMHTELQAAADNYSKTMQRLEKEAERLTTDIQADLKSLEQIVVDSAQAEA